MAAIGLGLDGFGGLLGSIDRQERFPIKGRWLGKVWPPPAFPTLPFVDDTPGEAIDCRALLGELDGPRKPARRCRVVVHDHAK